jgi:hypothetical protein
MTTMTLTLEAPFIAEECKAFEPKDVIIAQERELSVRQISHYIGKSPFRETGYNTTTFGHIGFTRVEAEHVTADTLLQARLDILCDKLRARY